MTFIPHRWAAMAATAGLAGLITVAAPAASASSHHSSRAGAVPAAVTPPARLLPMVVARGGAKACAIELTPYAVRALPAAGPFHFSAPFGTGRAHPIPPGVQRQPIVCTSLTCAGARHGLKAVLPFIRARAFKTRAIRLPKGTKPMAVGRLPFRSLPRFAVSACRSSK